MTKEQAIQLADSKWWEGVSDHDIVMFQLFEEKLCMPFGRFHEAVEKALGRSVWTHEFAFDGLKQEFLGDKPAPTWDEIVNLIPEEKRIIVQVPVSEAQQDAKGVGDVLK